MHADLLVDDLGDAQVDGEAAVVEWGDGGARVTFVRVDYDVEAAAAAILASDLPNEFAHYLRSGRSRLAPAS